MRDELVSLGAAQLAAEIAAGRCTAREAVDASIARIEAVNSALNAVVVKRFDEARAEADAADAVQREGGALGLLHGVPVTIKEQFAVAGMPTTLGVAVAENDEHDGPLVARLRAAGAIVVGKTNVPEFGAGANSRNPVWGATGNPFNPLLNPGGSSGGSASRPPAWRWTI